MAVSLLGVYGEAVVWCVVGLLSLWRVCDFVFDWVYMGCSAGPLHCCCQTDSVLLSSSAVACTAHGSYTHAMHASLRQHAILIRGYLRMGSSDYVSLVLSILEGGTQHTREGWAVVWCLES